MNRYLLDTHVWLWFQTSNDQQLTPGAVDSLLAWQKEESLFISPFSVWELAQLSLRKHVELGASIDAFFDTATEDDGVRVAPLTTQILIESTRLPGDIHRDPADRILVATAREEGLTLVTRDKLLLQYAKQGHLNAHKI